jgi:hypothetical protein
LVIRSVRSLIDDLTKPQRRGEAGERDWDVARREARGSVELKSVERVQPAHKKQVLPYLRLAGMQRGYLLNFGKARMKDGSTRIDCEE